MSRFINISIIINWVLWENVADFFTINNLYNFVRNLVFILSKIILIFSFENRAKTLV